MSPHSTLWLVDLRSQFGTEVIKIEKENYGTFFTRGIYVERQLLSDYDITFFIKKFKDYKVLDGTKILIGIGRSHNKKVSDQLCAKSCLEYFKPEILDLDLNIL